MILLRQWCGAMRPVIRHMVIALGLLGLVPYLAHAEPVVSDPAQAVLAANEAFYRAFSQRDIPAMDAIWSTEEQVAVSHPGWPRLTGRAAVMRSWRAILTNPGSPKIRVTNAMVKVDGPIAVVTGDELVRGSVLNALNVFALQQDGSWRMIGHHSGASRIRSADT